MNQPSHEAISDDLLSAYIDGAVTQEEKARIEAAIRADPSVAWRHETLRQTVLLLRSLPSVAAPRTFAVSESEVADVLARRRGRMGAQSKADNGWWRSFLGYLNSGNLMLRNAAAVAAALFVVLLVGAPFLNARQAPQPASAPQPVAVRAPEMGAGEQEPARALTLAVPAPAAPAEEAAPAAAPQAQSAAEEAAANPIPTGVIEQAAEAPRALEPAGEAAPDGQAAPRAALQPKTSESSAQPPVAAFAAPQAPTAMEESGAPAAAAALDLRPAEDASTPPQAATEEISPTATPEPTATIAPTPPAQEAVAVAPASESEAAQPASVAETNPQPAPETGAQAPFDLWRILQILSLALALILGGLWLYSRRANV